MCCAASLCKASHTYFKSLHVHLLIPFMSIKILSVILLFLNKIFTRICQQILMYFFQNVNFAVLSEKDIQNLKARMLFSTVDG